MFLLDTNTCIVAMNDIVGPVRARVREEQRVGRELLVSALSVFDLSYGAHKSARVEVNVQKVHTFLALLSQVPFDRADAEAAGSLRAELEKVGRPIGSYDYLIAGQALRRDLVLVTDNEKEFRRVGGLKVQNWIR